MMKPLRHRKYPGPGGMLVCSLLLHLGLFFLATTLHLMPKPAPREETTYYVDMVSLPVAAPEAGSPAPATAPPATPAPAPAPPVPPAPARPTPSSMTLPVAKAKPTPPAPTRAATSPAPKQAATPAPQKPAAAAPDSGQTEAQEFQAHQERLARLKHQDEERRQANVLAGLRKGGRTGAPVDKGSESGSDYASFIHSRLKDAFVSTIAYETKAPQVTVRLTIGVDGRITQYRVERSSGDKMFEAAVDRAVHLAERSFRKPPNGEVFEQGFVFRPQGIGVR